MKQAGLFVLVVAVVLWILLASSFLDGIRNGGQASVLATVTPSPTEPPAAPAAPATVVASATSAATATPLATVTATATPAATPVGEETYTVVRGDNLTKIARRFGVTLEALEQANAITDPQTLRAGDVLVIPAH